MKRYPSVILATCCVPWDSGYEFMEEIFRRQVRAIVGGLTKHVYIFGTAGEGYAVNDRQFERIAKVFREETEQPEVEAMLGVVSMSMSTILERIEHGMEVGYRAFQISLPSWGALTDREVDNFFRETCGRFTDCQFLHYNLPRTKRLLAGGDYARLTAAHPNLVAVKTDGDEEAMTDFFTKAPELQFFPGGTTYGRMRDRYEMGLLISLSAIHFEQAKNFFNARGEKLDEMLANVQAISDAMTEAVGDAAHMDGAFDKLICKVHDRDFPLRLLPPYESTTDEMFEKFLEGIPEEWKNGRVE